MELPNEQFNDDTGAVNKQQHIFKYLLTTFDHTKINGWGIKGTDSHWSTVRIPYVPFTPCITSSFPYLPCPYMAKNGRKRGRKTTKFTYAIEKSAMLSAGSGES